MRWIRRFSMFLGAICLAAFATGCVGPLWSTTEMMGAETAVEQAEKAGAEQKAPYEFFMAQEFLRKAQEEWGYSDFGTAQTYAEKAKDMAETATEKANTEPWTKPTSAIQQ